MKPRRRALIPALALALVALGLWQAGAGLFIHVKAVAAQVLLSNAWARTLDGESQARPWPWADTWPLARLVVPAYDIDQIVLAGASGRSLAFGPGHVDGTAAPGAAGTAVLSAHRDTHFRFLARLRTGDALELQRPDGTTQRYRVAALEVRNKNDVRADPDRRAPRLLLVTCYPFEVLRPNTPLRYVVTAEAVAGT